MAFVTQLSRSSPIWKKAEWLFTPSAKKFLDTIEYDAYEENVKLVITVFIPKCELELGAKANNDFQSGAEEFVEGLLKK